jgi:ricin-type beta-trefoil lectin protein
MICIPSDARAADEDERVRGFHGMCLDDAGDRSAERTAIVIRSCLPAAAAEDWTYRSLELRIHKDMCVNAKGKGASGSKVILWACNGSANEIWVHEPDGEYKLKAHGYALCLTDPGFSTTSETQLVVLTCADKSDQRWTLP